MRARTLFNRIMISLLLAMLVFAGTPFATGTAAASAASPYWKNANAKVTSETSVMLTWKKLTKKQQKKISGIAVFRNGKAVKKLKRPQNPTAILMLKPENTHTSSRPTRNLQRRSRCTGTRKPASGRRKK